MKSRLILNKKDLFNISRLPDYYQLAPCRNYFIFWSINENNISRQQPRIASSSSAHSEKSPLDIAIEGKNFSQAFSLLEKNNAPISRPSIFLNSLYQADQRDPYVIKLFRILCRQQDSLREAKLPVVNQALWLDEKEYGQAKAYLNQLEQIHRDFTYQARHTLEKTLQKAHPPGDIPSPIVDLIARYDEKPTEENGYRFFSEEKQFTSDNVKMWINSRKDYLKKVIKELKEMFNPNISSPVWYERVCGGKLFCKEEQDTCRAIIHFADGIEGKYLSKAMISAIELQAAVDLIEKNISLHCKGFAFHFEIKKRESQFLEKIKEFSDQYWLRPRL